MLAFMREFNFLFLFFNIIIISLNFNPIIIFEILKIRFIFHTKLNRLLREKTNKIRIFN